MSQVTKPMMLDETGQAIVTALGNIGNAVQPTNVCVDLPVSIPANGWSNSSPYTYTYTHSKITAECGVTVEFESGASNTDCLAMDYEKVAGGVMFTVKTKPSSAVPVIIHVLNAEAEGITSVSADMVSTSAISGSSNVEQALGALNSNMTNVTTGQVAVNSSKVTSGTLDITTCRKIGKFVHAAARVHSITDGTVTATGVFFTIPEGFRPVATTYGYAYLNIDGSFVPIFASIGTNGEVQINYTSSKHTTQVFFCANYVV